MEGKIKKNIFYTVELENGENIPIDKKTIKIYGLVDGQIVDGFIKSDTKQDQYDNGEYARSYSENKEFIISEIKNKK